MQNLNLIQKRLLVSLIYCLSLSACATGLGRSLHQVSSLDHETTLANAKPVSVESTQDVVIAAFDTQFADDAYAKLLAECPTGKVINVVARHSTNLGFFGYKNTLRLSGYCI